MNLNSGGGSGGSFAAPSSQQGQQAQPPLPTPPIEGSQPPQQFCLRWNSYPATVATQLAELRSNEDFVDVTLACGGKYLKAHQLVLAACSPYFMQMFKSTPCQHPVIFLNDVGFRQLQALLEFMYAGEVNVSQLELPALLRTAEALQVRGLADTTTANNNNNNSTNCPPQHQPKQNFSPQPQYGQPVMNNSNNNNTNTLSQHPQQQQQPAQLAPLVDQSGMAMPCSSSSDMNNLHPPQQTTHTPQQHQQQQPRQIGNLPVVSSSIQSPIATSSSMPSSINNSKLERNPSVSGQDPENKAKDEEDEDGEDDFEMLEALGQQSKNNNYMHDGNGNMTGQLEDGQIFPDDPLVMGFEVVGDDEDDVGNDNENNENQSGEESSEVSDDDDDDGECKEFTYQSDASYSQEGLNEGDGIPNPNNNGENSAGPSNLHPGVEPGLIPDFKLDGKDGLGGGSAKNRLSRSLWPPGIPYHGPQQCPYCTRVLSNVGNWRKHVLTMHFAREKIFKCRHCTSSFRTAEYLQKHYVRVHNYPQKMTRRKYVEQT